MENSNRYRKSNSKQMFIFNQIKHVPCDGNSCKTAYRNTQTNFCDSYKIIMTSQLRLKKFCYLIKLQWKKSGHNLAVYLVTNLTTYLIEWFHLTCVVCIKVC